MIKILTLFVLIIIKSQCIIINLPQFLSSLKLIKSNMNLCNLKLKNNYQFPNFDIHDNQNLNCQVCAKLFRNQSYLHFHQISRHFHNDNNNNYLLSNQICLFSTCKMPEIQLSVEIKMKLCIQFVHRYMQIQNKSNLFNDIKREDTFCRNLISAKITHEEKNGLQTFYKICKYFLFLVYLMWTFVYYFSLYDKLIARKKKTTKSK